MWGEVERRSLKGSRGKEAHSARGAKRCWCTAHNLSLRSKAVAGYVGPLGSFSSNGLFHLAWLKRLPSWPGAGSPRRGLQYCSLGHFSSLLSCAHLDVCPRFLLSLQCTHMTNPSTIPRRLHPSSFMSGLACFIFTRELLRVLMDFITVLTPSGRHIFLIRSLKPVT